MKSYSKRFIFVRILLSFFVTFGITSCVMPDPLYMQNVGRISDIEYPPEKIIGTWAAMSVSPFQTLTQDMESKTYYDLRSGGGGRARQADRNNITGSYISMEASIRWAYLGQNRWKISIPGSSAWRVTSSKNMTKGECAPFGHVVRYLDGRLYTDKGRVWVKAQPGEVSRMAQRLRSQPKLIRVTGGY